jgi:26S proteasome non-ATPase regulatory subunit 9
MAGRQALLLLSDEAKVLEGEIAALMEMLTTSTTPGVDPVGVRGNLLDADGFPRADVDVHAIRIARHTLACKQTDHKALMKRIEASLLAIHAGGARSAPRIVAAAPLAAPLAAASSAGSVEIAMAPFATVNSVADDSPAATAGLRGGDLVVRFGDVNRTNCGEGLGEVGALVANARGAPIEVLVDRAGTRRVLSLTPRTWSGRGLLGCHLLRA